MAITNIAESNGDYFSSIKNKKYKQFDDLKTKFCTIFIDDLLNDLKKIQIIKPTLETRDIHDKTLSGYLEGCEMDKFVVGTRERPRHLNTGKGKEPLRVMAPTGDVVYTHNDFALYKFELPNTAEGKTDYVLYMGPRYMFKENYDTGEKKKVFLYGGIFRRITQPSCIVGVPTTVGGKPKTESELARESQFIKYNEQLFLVRINFFGEGISLSKELGNGKVEQICSFYKSDF